MLQLITLLSTIKRKNKHHRRWCALTNMMDMEKKLPTRKNTRLQVFDYNIPTVYFVTICTEHKKQILSNSVEDVASYKATFACDDVCFHFQTFLQQRVWTKYLATFFLRPRCQRCKGLRGTYKLCCQKSDAVVLQTSKRIMTKTAHHAVSCFCRLFLFRHCRGVVVLQNLDSLFVGLKVKSHVLAALGIFPKSYPQVFCRCGRCCDKNNGF